MIDPDERTNSVGLFNTARSYWRAAEHLRQAKLEVTHPSAPIAFLFCHGIELYLKSFLRAQDAGLDELKKWGHNIAKLSEVAKERGLPIEDHTMEILHHVAEDNVAMEARYIVTGFKSVPTDDALSSVSQELDLSVCHSLAQKGFSVRAEKFESKTASVDQCDIPSIEEELTELNPTEREILAYLLHRNERLFECALDGGNARTLLSRGIVRIAVQPGQVIDPENTPMEIPRAIWQLLKRHQEDFTYKGSDDDPHPWRVHWMLR